MQYLILYILLAVLCIAGIKFNDYKSETVLTIQSKPNMLRGIFAIFVIYTHCTLAFDNLPAVLIPLSGTSGRSRCGTTVRALLRTSSKSSSPLPAAVSSPKNHGPAGDTVCFVPRRISKQDISVAMPHTIIRYGWQGYHTAYQFHIY